MTENRISGYLYNELFSKSNEEKCTVFQRMVWFLIVHKNTIKNWSTALQVFPSGLSLGILSILQGRDTSAVLQPSVQHLVYVFPIFFLSH